MIQDANAGAIRIMARRRVFRRYVVAEELLALGIAEGGVGPATIESGGELVEMAELAARIAAVVRPDAVITRARSTSRPGSLPLRRPGLGAALPEMGFGERIP